MNTFHLLDPSARDFVGRFPVYDPSRQTLADYRQIVDEAYSRRAAPTPLNYEELTIPGRGGPGVRVLLYRPETRGPDMPAIIHLHGGGFFSGTAGMIGAESRALADEHAALVMAVDYRLAPETPFPGPLEDCYVALDWLFVNAATLGVDPARIAIMGGSAGGGLAAALALLARDRKPKHRLAAQLLIYPMLDPRTGTPDAPADNEMAGQFVWTRGANRFGWEQMRGGKAISPEAMGYYAPALAHDLSGLPAAFLAVGALDLLADESLAYASRLMRAGVQVEAHLYPGAPHGFRSIQGRLGEHLAADIGRAVGRYFARATD